MTIFGYALYKVLEKIWEESVKAARAPGTETIRARVLRWARRMEAVVGLDAARVLGGLGHVHAAAETLLVLARDDQAAGLGGAAGVGRPPIRCDLPGAETIDAVTVVVSSSP